MKKCPYCHTLTNDDATTCPNCLHDISTLRPMPEPIGKRFNSYIYSMIFGIIFILGGIVAGLNQKSNMEHFLSLSKGSGLTPEQVQDFIRLSKNAQFEMSLMFALSVIGTLMVVIAIIFLVKKVIKEKKNK